MIKRFYKPNHFIMQFITFGFIGGIGLFVNLGLYNLIVFLLQGHQLISNVLSTSLTIIFNWLGNRFLTFKGGKQAHTEVAQFFAVSAVALPLNAVSLYITRDILGFMSPLAANLSIVIATLIGMVFKFILYKFWVFKS